MLIAAAVCPHPPLLVPAALGGAACEPPPALRAVADACAVAVHSLVAAEPGLIPVVGGGPRERRARNGLSSGNLGPNPDSGFGGGAGRGYAAFSGVEGGVHRLRARGHGRSLKFSRFLPIGKPVRVNVSPKKALSCGFLARLRLN